MTYLDLYAQIHFINLIFTVKIINKPPAQFVYKVPFWTAAVNNAMFVCLYQNKSTPTVIKHIIFVAWEVSFAPQVDCKHFMGIKKYEFWSAIN